MADIIRAKNGEYSLRPLTMVEMITRNARPTFPSRSVTYLFQTTDLLKYLEESESEGHHFVNWVIQRAGLEIFVLLKDTFMAPKLKDLEFIHDLIIARSHGSAIYKGELPLLLRFLLENELPPLPHELRKKIHEVMSLDLRIRRYGLRNGVKKVEEALRWFDSSPWKNMILEVQYTFTKEGKLVLGGFPTV